MGGKRERFRHVVRDQDDGFPNTLLNLAELAMDFRARHRIKSAEGLVHQENRWICGERARHTHTLALTSRQLIRTTEGVFFRLKSHQLEQFVDALLDPRSVPRQQPRNESNVLGNGEMREETDLLHHVTRSSSKCKRIPGCCRTRFNEHLT